MIGEFIYIKRKSFKWSQSNLAIMSGCSRATIDRIETDKHQASFKLVVLILNCLDSSLCEYEKFIKEN